MSKQSASHPWNLRASASARRAKRRGRTNDPMARYSKISGLGELADDEDRAEREELTELERSIRTAFLRET